MARRAATADIKPEPPRRRLAASRAARDMGDVERLSLELLARVPGDAPIRRGLARTLVALGRGADAQPHWQQLNLQNGRDFEAAFHVAQHRIAQGASLESAAAEAAESSPGELFANLTSVLQARGTAVPRDYAGIRHVAICGVSFSGSTLMDRVLGGLPGVASIGESHWLTKARFPHGYDLIDFSAPSGHPLPYCSVCGAKCLFLTMEFRRELAADYTDWYFRVAQRLETQILVSADKNVPKLVDHDPLLRLDALIMFKSPVQAWISAREKLPGDLSEERYLEECAKYLDTWVQNYEILCHRFRPTGRVAFLSFDDFVRAPHEVLAKACTRLDLPFDASVLMATRPGHAIGGNARAMKRIRSADYKIEIVPLPEPALPRAERDMTAQHGLAQALHAELLAAYSP